MKTPPPRPTDPEDHSETAVEDEDPEDDDLQDRLTLKTATALLLKMKTILRRLRPPKQEQTNWFHRYCRHRNSTDEPFMGEKDHNPSVN